MRKLLKKFDCGCEWEIAVDDSGEVVGVNFEPEQANINCPKVWDIIASGKTKGIFQLETPLGQSTAKKCRPYGVQELSDVISILRPGVGDAQLDGKSLKQHYIDRKNGEEEPAPPHPLMGDFLKETQMVGIYQEQYMRTAQEMAGFSGEESYAFLKACAKKLPEKMALFKEKFISGCQSHSGLSKERAEELFSVLEAGQRYLFNLSHSVSYSIDALKYSAYAKAHFPRVFFLSELEFSRSNLKKSVMEVRGDIIDDARNFNVEIRGPDLRLKNAEFILRDRVIYYGLGRVKDVGEAKFKKLIEQIQDVDVQSLSWCQLLNILKNSGIDIANSLIRSGALDFTQLTRSRMAFEFDIFNKLTAAHREYIAENHASLLEGIDDILSQGKGKDTLCKSITTFRKLEKIRQQLINPPKSLTDTKTKIFNWERELLGYAFTCTEIDDIDVGDCTCQEFLEGKTLDEYNIPGIITLVKPYTTKGKEPKEMAFIDFKDSTQKINAVAFPNTWEEYQHKLFDGNKLLFTGVKTVKGSFQIKKVYQL